MILEISNITHFLIASTRLIIKTSTWVRDSHELFDYESPHLMKKSYKIAHSSKVLFYQ